jgi:hypothetical protein
VIEEVRWKFVASISVIAMAVSLVSGGLSGIGFGVIVLRAFIGGLLFAVLAVALNLAVVRFFPEILETEKPSDGEHDAPGGRVDITVPAEAPVLNDEYDELSDRRQGEESGLSDVNDDVADAEPVDEQIDRTTVNMDDLDRFSGTFSDVDDEQETKGRRSNGSGGGQDPEELAQAIQTVIKRDEKG